PPAFRYLSLYGKRVVNTAVVSCAQQLGSLRSAGGLAILAKETTARSVFGMRDGTRKECVRRMPLSREAMSPTNRESDDLAGLKERIDLLRASAAYSGDEDTIPLTDSIGTLAPPSKPVSGLESINKAGVNVLVDDYWDVYSALLK